MKQRLNSNLLWLFVVAVLLGACKKQDLSPRLTSDAQGDKLNYFYGPAQRVGNGLVRSYSLISHSGAISEIGLEMTAGALENLPEPTGTAGPEFSWLLELHQKARALTPFDHLEMDWNPAGHPPPGVYDLPHFDLHFYKISKEEQRAIPEYGPTTMAMFDNPPPDGYLPAGYVPGPGGVPMMGKHWLDITSPEFNGGSFTYTFIYGTFDGSVIFLEPMYTKAFLEGLTTDVTVPIRQPMYFDPVNTNYPTAYKFSKDEKTGNIRISLTGFEWKE